MKATTLAKIERTIRPLIKLLPAKFAVSRCSAGRMYFLDNLKKDIPEKFYNVPENLSRTLWGIKFRSPIMNAAGMFKNGECYEMVAKQGAAAYLGGTGTWNKRSGNKKDGIYLPWMPYPKSHASSNWLGLPNYGDQVNSDRAGELERIAECPVGWSVAESDTLEERERLDSLVHGMELYSKSGVDFLEWNMSCPNTNEGKLNQKKLSEKLKYVKEKFLDKRERELPVIVKFSNDTEISQIPFLLDLLFELKYDGVNFGNTSTAYNRMRDRINPMERRHYDFFVKTFGGGISGRPLKTSSLALASTAVEYVKKGPPSQEFHVIRTGGIESWEDIQQSEAAGISLNQWFTGYFEKFARDGHKVYKNLLKF